MMGVLIGYDAVVRSRLGPIRCVFRALCCKSCKPEGVRSKHYFHFLLFHLFTFMICLNYLIFFAIFILFIIIIFLIFISLIMKFLFVSAELQRNPNDNDSRPSVANHCLRQFLLWTYTIAFIKFRLYLNFGPAPTFRSFRRS